MHRILKLDSVWFSHSVVSDPFVTPWTAAHQAPLSLGFSRQESWSGLPFPSPEDLPNLGIEPRSPNCRQTLDSLSQISLNMLQFLP